MAAVVLGAAVLVLMVLAQVAGATKYGAASHQVTSANGAFVVRVGVDADMQTVATSDAPREALWSIPRPARLEQFFVSDGGRAVAIVAWELVMMIELWTPAGRTRHYTVRELVAHPSLVHGVGPIGGSWRVWHDGVTQIGDSLEIATTGLYSYTLDLRLGKLVDARSSRAAWSRRRAGSGSRPPRSGSCS